MLARWVGGGWDFGKGMIGLDKDCRYDNGFRCVVLRVKPRLAGTGAHHSSRSVTYRDDR